MKSLALKQQAINLREKGNTYTFISSLTGVSKSTLSDWLSDTPYKPNAETVKRIGAARAASGLVKHNIKLKSVSEAFEVAKTDIAEMSKRDLFMFGLGIYVGEGTKTGDEIRIINSDPMIIRFMIKWLKDVCGLSDDNFRIRLHLYPDSDEKGSKRFWASYTGISTKNFRKSQIDRRVDKKRINNGKLPYGTAHLQVKSNGKKEFGVFLGRRIRAWMKIALQV